jgi:putative effector of murein hydrolase
MQEIKFDLKKFFRKISLTLLFFKVQDWMQKKVNNFFFSFFISQIFAIISLKYLNVV